MATEKFYPKGEYVFREGESADFAYILTSGTLEIVKTGIDGDVVLAVLEDANTLFGEMALMDGAPRMATLYAVEDCVLARLSRESFMQLLRDAQMPAIKLLWAMSSVLFSRFCSAELCGCLFTVFVSLSCVSCHSSKFDKLCSSRSMSRPRQPPGR